MAHKKNLVKVLSNEFLHVRKSLELAGVGFIFTLGAAIVSSILSIYLYETFFLTKSEIGFVQLLSTLVYVMFSFLIPPLLKRFHVKKAIIISTVGLILLYIMWAFNQSFLLFLLIFLLVLFFRVIRNNSFNILYRDEGKDIKLSEKEGYLFTMYNSAWFLAPFFLSLLLEKYNVNSMFMIAAFLFFVGLLIYLMLPIKDPHRDEKEKSKLSCLKNLGAFWKQKHYRVLYILSSGYHIWWSFVFVYMPILILEQGFRPSVTTLFLSLTLVPVIMTEFKFSRLAETYSAKSLFIVSYFIIAFSTALAFLVPDFIFKMLLMVIGSIGFAIGEPLREIYFFTHTKSKEEENFYPVFTTYNAFGSTIGIAIFAAFFLTGIASEYAFALLALLMTFFLLPVKHIKEKTT